jgi:DNA replication licensing factor MCM6
VPAGSLPRTLEVIFRNDVVEQARAGDKLVFTGTLVVVPDVSVITAPGQRSMVKGAGVEWPSCLLLLQHPPSPSPGA